MTSSRFVSTKISVCQAISRTKCGLYCKVTALVDGRGRVQQLSLAPGNAADLNAVKELVLPAHAHIVADKGYDSDSFRKRSAEKVLNRASLPDAIENIVPHIIKAVTTRHRVDQFFQRVKRFRRIGTRYEKLDQTYLCMLTIAAVIDWLKYRF